MSEKTKKKEEEKKKDDKKKEKKDKKEEEDDEDDDDEDDDDLSDDSHDSEGSGSGSEKHSKGGIGHRLKKNIAGKVMTSSLGKKIIPPQLRGLLKGLKRIIARVINQKTANQIEKNMIRLIVKAKLAIDAKKVKEDEFMAADAPLRKAFDVIVDMYDYYGDELNDRMKAKFESAAKYMAEVGNITRTVLSPHIQPHTIARLKMVFDTLCNTEFLVKVWQNPNTGKDLEDLIDAMHKYTQFH